MLDGVVDIPLPGQALGDDSGSSRGHKSTARLRQLVLGPENRLVEVAVGSVLDGSGNQRSPVVLHGVAGTGKSHIALGLVAAWKASFPRRPVVAVTAIDFARELADAMETKTLDDFGSRYRLASLLVLEDLDYIDNKQYAQQELLHTFDALIDAGSRIVVTARSAPSELGGIIPRLRSRLAGGLVVPVVPPGTAARLTILKRLAELRKVYLSESAAEILADGLCVTVPELLGALAQLQVSAQLDAGNIIDGESARLFLAERLGSRIPSIHQIALKTARHFSLKLGELRSPSRRREVVTARGVAMYLTRTLTPNSLEKIGSYFGGRDHTTVSYGCQKTEKLLDTELAVRRAVNRLQQELRTA